MATEYGIRYPDHDQWIDPEISREKLEQVCKRYGFPLIAREVSEPRIVSIRA